jgi:uncharacterized protein (TIGR00730 family)
MQSLCVYCSSSDAVDAVYFEAARELGSAIAAAGYALIYGGTHVGLMGEVARAVHAHAPAGKVVGVIPQGIYDRALGYGDADELIVTRDLRERKHVMESRADGFIALPGGIGTFEEVLEVLTLKQLRMHTKPIVLLNVAGYYDPLITLLEHAITGRFMKESSRQLWFAAPDVPSAMQYLHSYQPPVIETKWVEAAEAAEA